MSEAVAEKRERDHEEMAIQAIMNARAANEKKVDVDTLTGKKKRDQAKKKTSKEERRVVSLDEKREELGSLEDSLGKAVNN